MESTDSSILDYIKFRNEHVVIIQIIKIITIFYFTSDHDNNFQLRLEVEEVDSKQSDWFVEMVGYWSVEMVMALLLLLVAQIDLDTCYFVRLVVPMASELRGHCDIVVEHKWLHTRMNMNNGQFRLL